MYNAEIVLHYCDKYGIIISQAKGGDIMARENKKLASSIVMLITSIIIALPSIWR